MKLNIDFNNGVEPIRYEYSADGKAGLPPFELKIGTGSKLTKQKAIVNYLQQLDYAFRCLNNNVDDIIQNVELKNLWFLKDIKKDKTTYFGLGTDLEETQKYDIIIYDITAGVITEKMYLTRNGSQSYNTRVYTQGTSDTSDKDLSFDDAYGNKINMELLLNSEGAEASLNIITMMALTEKFIKKYKLKWNSISKQVQLMTSDDQVINYLGIKEEDVYTFFKLFTLLLEKGNHIGVFYINALNYTTPVLKALLKLIEIQYGKKSVVFLYNCQFLKMNEIPREVITLPNYLIEGKNSKDK